MSSKSPPILITGTDTGVGKTLVGAALAMAFRNSGQRVVAVKPIESGCEDLVAEDGVLLAEASGQAAPRAALLRLRAPLAPPLAADLEGVDIDFATLCGECRALSRVADITIVEGAGGLLTPLSWEHTALDLARALGATALVVVADRLGCVNHTLLTLNALKAAGVDTMGVVLSAPLQTDESTGTNQATIERVSGISRVLTLSRVGSIEEASLELKPILLWGMAA